jgi:cyclopropane fatty-acyl-phospholipid synthase-like methyltransferase
MTKFSNLSTSYDQNYFENGVATGVSGYENYRWMPELTMRMAFHMIDSLGIKSGQSVLDFGCAKGFLVKAFRLFDFDAYGCDVSSYAISMVDKEIEKFCWAIDGCGDKKIFTRKYDWMISKDVFEHLRESDLRILMKSAGEFVDKMFLVIPLSENDEDGKYIIPEYDKDITHILAKSTKWWVNLFEESGWNVADFSHTFNGCKENWTAHWPNGNGFFTLHNSRSV